MHRRLLDSEALHALFDNQLDDGVRGLIGTGRRRDFFQYLHLFESLPQTPVLLLELTGMFVGGLGLRRHIVPVRCGWEEFVLNSSRSGHC